MLEVTLAPAALLRLLKRSSGALGGGSAALGTALPRYRHPGLRRPAGRQTPRRRERGRLVLPHPELHSRAFVLVPLLEIAPHWRHPVLGVAGRTLLARIAPRKRAGVLQALDFAAPACDKTANESALRNRGFRSAIFVCSSYLRGINAWRA